MTAVFISLRYGKAGPTWVTALQLAEEWGVPPWEIMEAPGSLRWAARRAVYQKALAKVKKLQSK